MYWVSRQLGHTDIETTLKHYARFLPHVQERNLGLLNAYFQGRACVRTGSRRLGSVGALLAESA